MMNGSEHPVGAEAQARTETIDVPETARVRCPLVDYRARKVGDHCPQCKHFGGLNDRFPGGKHSFYVRYAVICSGEPVRREILEVEA